MQRRPTADPRLLLQFRSSTSFTARTRTTIAVDGARALIPRLSRRTRTNPRAKVARRGSNPSTKPAFELVHLWSSYKGQKRGLPVAVGSGRQRSIRGGSDPGAAWLGGSGALVKRRGRPRSSVARRRDSIGGNCRNRRRRVGGDGVGQLRDGGGEHVVRIGALRTLTRFELWGVCEDLS